MFRITGFLSQVSWGVWITVVVLNSLGVTHVPWNVAIAPIVSTGVLIGIVLVGAFTKKEILKKALEEIEKEKHAEIK